MEKRSFWRRYQLVIVLSFLVGALGTIKALYQESSMPVDITDIPVPTVLPSITQIIKTEELEQATSQVVPTIEKAKKDPDYPLWQLLPYPGRGFIVDRYTKPLTIAVITKGIDKTIVEKDVNKWLEDNGVEAETHQIIWEKEN